MAIAVDLNERRVDASVRALAERESPRVRSGIAAALRAELGVEVHRRVRTEAAAQVPGYRGEVSVQLRLGLRLEGDDFTAIVRGRIDGVIELEHQVVVEEVKSTVEAQAAIERTSIRAWPAACAQVRLYALALVDAEETRPITARLRIVSLVDGSEHLREVPFVPETTRAWLCDTLRAVIEEARALDRRRDVLARWAEGVAFPHAPWRPHQAALVDALREALVLERPIVVDAPTGLGKTACAMTAALAHALGHGARLLWLTAKTTQQELAARTLEQIVEATGAPPVPLSAVTLRAKAAMCATGRQPCRPLACPMLDDFEARLVATEAVARLRSGRVHVPPDAIAAFGRAHRLCPWELALRVAELSDVVIGDLNYVFDPVGSLAITRAIPRVVVIDEAHNLPERARGHDSPFLPRIAVEEASAAARGDADDADLGDALHAWLGALQVWIEAHARRAADEERSGLEGQATIDLDLAGLEALCESSRALELRHFKLRLRAAASQPDAIDEDPVGEVFDRVRRIVLALGSAHVVPYVADATAPRGRGLGLVAVDSAPRLSEVHAEALGTIAMSATMGPLDRAARELGLGAMHPIRLAVPSPFPRVHRRIVVVGDVDTSLAGRAAAYDPIARHIETVIEARPGNYVAFFPSFAFLAEVRRRLAVPRDALLVQLPGMPVSDRSRALAQLRGGDRPRLLLAVSGGAFAEGVDLPGDALVGAIVVGPPLPAIDFARELRRAHHEAAGDDGLAEAYGLPAITRVVQAAGRVIRTMDDRGVIVLLGRRFLEPRWQEALPSDWASDPAGPLVVEDLHAALRDFWSSVEAQPASRQRTPSGPW